MPGLSGKHPTQFHKALGHMVNCWGKKIKKLRNVLSLKIQKTKIGRKGTYTLYTIVN